VTRQVQLSQHSRVGDRLAGQDVAAMASVPEGRGQAGAARQVPQQRLPGPDITPQ